MAQIQKTAYDRYARYVGKKLQTTIRGLRPTAIAGRFTGPRVLLNSIPKAGTHLMERYLERLPGMRNAGWRTLMGPLDVADAGIVKKIGRIGRGEFVNAHLPCREEVGESVAVNDVRLVFMVRDPRDIVVSRYKYVTQIDRLHPAHDHMSELPSDHDRLMASIEGVDGLMPDIATVLRAFAPWLTHPNAWVCRFEDLIGESGGGSAQKKADVIGELLEFLGLQMSASEMDAMLTDAGKAKSSTFRRGAIGTWSEEFSPEHLARFEQLAGVELAQYGYERYEA